MLISNVIRLIICLLVFFPINTIAELSTNTKIATVDVNKILNKLPEAKSKRAELDKLSKKAKQEVESKRAKLKKLEAKIKGSDPTSVEAENFRKQAREFERFVRDTEEDIKRKFITTNQVLTKKVLAKIEQYAKKNKIDLVLDKGASKSGPILFGTPTADITDAVLKSS